MDVHVRLLTKKSVSLTTLFYISRIFFQLKKFLSRRIINAPVAQIHELMRWSSQLITRC